MPSRIEDYALIGNCRTAALVARDGSLDWLCFPRFDSGACFASLLGGPEHGRWIIAPVGDVRAIRRSYRPNTLILETEYDTDDGTVKLIDFMPPMQQTVIRLVVCRRGRVTMRTEIAFRFDYGSLVPWVRREEGGIAAIAGPETLELRSDVHLHGENFKSVGEFTVTEGDRSYFTLSWHPSHKPAAKFLRPDYALQTTEKWWQKWVSQCTYQGEWREAVVRSLITLKALTYEPTGGIVAAPTTSLPEQLGGVRNWDYRYCWLRDATLTLYALMMNGYHDEARAWREWLLRAVAGKASQLQIMYGVTGERRLTELVLDWLPGYENAAPVRIGNAASGQFQLDVFGEVMDSLYLARRVGLQTTQEGWRVERELLDFLESRWNQPDEGIWEVRGPRRHFTHSKVMAWVALDCAVKNVERFGLDGPIDRWRTLRDTIHGEVCEKGFDSEIGSFVQYYGGKQLDASLLMMAEVGFLPVTDVRIKGTIEAIERNLLRDGFVDRYSHAREVDGLPVGEGAFLPCTFWLADNYSLMGRHDDAHRLFEKLLAIRNDVGLLSEEYDPVAQRLVGNFPQAFTHVGLVNTAHNLTHRGGPAEHRQHT